MAKAYTIIADDGLSGTLHDWMSFVACYADAYACGVNKTLCSS